MKLKDAKQGQIVKVLWNGIKYEVIKAKYPIIDPIVVLRGIDGRTNGKLKGFNGESDCEVVATVE